MRKYYKVWTGIVAACLAALVVAALVLPQSFQLTALSDLIQCVLLLSGTTALISHAVRTRGRLRLFWGLMSVGIGFWCSYQMLWVYYEIWLRTPVPDLFAGDMILFLHIVPLMAALVLRPHAPQDEYAARVRNLDFALLMVWWVYLYVLIVIPWQYVVPNFTPYNHNLNFLYLIEKAVFLGTLLAAWFGSKAGWKWFYANLFGACFTYAASSYFANWALSRHSYYSGSLYDIPLATSMAWITVIGLWTHEREPQAGVRSISTGHGVWLARLGMIAAFSLPLFGSWVLLDSSVPPRIRSFRLIFTLMASILMGVMVFVRQRLLDRELLRLITYSQESFKNLKRLQSQITESEKLASIGQLVAGAAHELNNPITAILGYSDLLLLSKPFNPEQCELAAKIGQHSRRTKSLVSSLLSFAKPSPATMAPVDLKTLLRTAVKLSQSQWQTRSNEVQTNFAEEILLVRGDSNQLLQVCVQIINDALRAMEQEGSKVLSISLQGRDDFAVIEVSDSKLTAEDDKDEKGDNQEGNPKDDTEIKARPGMILSSLGLSACEAILRQHRGRLSCPQTTNARIAVRVELPLITAARERLTALPPAAWEPQPSA